MKDKEGKIVKIPIECETLLYLLNQKKAINTSSLSKSNQTTLGILARKTSAIKIERGCFLMGEEVKILYTTPKKVVIQLPT